MYILLHQGQANIYDKQECEIYIQSSNKSCTLVSFIDFFCVTIVAIQMTR